MPMDLKRTQQNVHNKRIILTTENEQQPLTYHHHSCREDSSDSLLLLVVEDAGLFHGGFEDRLNDRHSNSIANHPANV